MQGYCRQLRLQLGAEWASSASRYVMENDDKVINQVSTPEWTSLIRGSHAARSERPGLFFPIYATPDGSSLKVGDTDTNRHNRPADRTGLCCLAMRTDGSEGVWQVGPEESA